MKVTRVEIFDINVEKMPTWHPVIIRVHTDEGIAGVGEVGLAYSPTFPLPGAPISHWSFL